MQESAQAALSYVRSMSKSLEIPMDYWDQHDLHLHVPTGAQPKDGPSAGITMAVALASLATGRAVRSDIGMTGEVTLRGKVLPVGGVKEKVLAAHRAGLTTVLLPQRNEIDIEDVPEEVRKEINFVFADSVTEAISVALCEEPTKSVRKRRTASSSKTKKPSTKRTKSRAGRKSTRRSPKRKA